MNKIILPESSDHVFQTVSYEIYEMIFVASVQYCKELYTGENKPFIDFIQSSNGKRQRKAFEQGAKFGVNLALRRIDK
jgi:hypothetical protein